MILHRLLAFQRPLGCNLTFAAYTLSETLTQGQEALLLDVNLRVEQRAISMFCWLFLSYLQVVVDCYCSSILGMLNVYGSRKIVMVFETSPGDLHVAEFYHTSIHGPTHLLIVGGRVHIHSSNLLSEQQHCVSTFSLILNPSEPLFLWF